MYDPCGNTIVQLCKRNDKYAPKDVQFNYFTFVKQSY